MKTKEFIEKIEELGYIYSSNDMCINVYNEEDLLMKVYNMTPYTIDIYWCEDVPSDLFDLGVEYAKTPIEEREEPKYYLRLSNDLIGVELMCSYYLNFNKLAKKHFFDTKLETTISQTQFTQVEIDKLDTTHLIKEEVK